MSNDRLVSTALWHRLDAPGHDAARLAPHGDGWRLSGVAAFLGLEGPVAVAYEVVCGPDWRTRSGTLHGSIGDIGIDCHVTATAEGWHLNGRAVDGVEDCADLDLGFTPATNILQLRRLALAHGAEASCPVAWLDASIASSLVRLPQRYRRTSSRTYAYDAPTVPYAAELELLPNGFVRRYPGLWEAST
jgi:uncharacterized protein